MKLAAAGLILALSGCLTPIAWQRAGLTPEILLALEVAGWEARARYGNVPKQASPGAKPIAIRELNCPKAIRAMFECSYVVDYGRNGIVEGSYRETNSRVGRGEDGKWSHWITIA